MARKQIRNLEELIRGNWWLHAECNACGHKAKLDPSSLRRTFARRGWQTDLENVERRLVCSQCESKSVYIGPGFKPGLIRGG